MSLQTAVPSSRSSDDEYGLVAPPPHPDPPTVTAEPELEPGPTPAIEPEPVSTPASAAASSQPPSPPRSPKKKRKRKRSVRFLVPSWAVSLAVHIVILFGLAAVTLSHEPVRKLLNIDSALVANPGGADEMVKIWADPSNQPRDQAVGSEGGGVSAPAGSGGGGGPFGGIGTGPPSNTPRVAGGGGNVNEKNGLPGVNVVAHVSGLGLATIATPSMDLGGGGMIGGDVTYGTKNIGEALDQLAREILRHLTQHKLTVVWLFDESESMKDDQKAIRQKFDRVATELKVNSPAASKGRDSAALNHAIVGYGAGIHYVLKKPTLNVDLIGEAIDRLKIDESGTENTMHAIVDVVNTYSSIISKDRKLLIVLVTDESGDDGAYVEEAHEVVVHQKVPIYIIGRQSLFGYHRVHFQYVDPVTKDVFWPEIRRGPETADLEVLQWDGLHDRWDEQPSGFAPYELARLAKDTGGIYFLLPTEETFRIHQREKAYSIQTLKELVPDYASRVAYVKRRTESELRRSIYDIIQMTKGYSFRLAFSVNLEEMIPQAAESMAEATARLNGLIAIEQKLKSLERLRDRETDKRWQANYDLLLAQVVAYQIKAYEYRACLEEMIKKRPVPKQKPNPPKLEVWWGLGHAKEPKAPKDKTGKKYVEAARLFKLVIERYPNTPWADLAQDEINRGFSVGWGEASHVPSPTRAEREKFVPKY